jgi:hypothetical protein
MPAFQGTDNIIDNFNTAFAFLAIIPPGIVHLDALTSGHISGRHKTVEGTLVLINDEGLEWFGLVPAGDVIVLGIGHAGNENK